MSDVRPNIVCKIYGFLGLEVNMALDGLSKNVAYAVTLRISYGHANIDSDCFTRLSEEEQCSLYTAIGQLACASVQNVSEVSVGGRDKCYICDTDRKDTNVPAPWEGSGSAEAFSTIISLIKLPKTHRLRRPRVSAMLALRRLLSHTSKEEYLDLKTSAFGQWCLQALHSSTRELRIAAALVMTR